MVGMLIGSDFNKRCEKILLAAGKECDYVTDKKISVEVLTKELELDRVEIRHLFQYLIDLKLIKIETIGGPALYGHISLTQKGILKVKSLENKSG